MNDDQRIFLSAANVERLTGYTRSSKQIEWLRTNGIACWLNALGAVIVWLSAIKGKRAARSSHAPEWTPDFPAMKAGKAKGSHGD